MNGFDQIDRMLEGSSPQAITGAKELYRKYDVTPLEVANLIALAEFNPGMLLQAVKGMKERKKPLTV